MVPTHFLHGNPPGRDRGRGETRVRQQPGAKLEYQRPLLPRAAQVHRLDGHPSLPVQGFNKVIQRIKPDGPLARGSHPCVGLSGGLASDDATERLCVGNPVRLLVFPGRLLGGATGHGDYSSPTATSRARREGGFVNGAPLTSGRLMGARTPSGCLSYAARISARGRAWLGGGPGAMATAPQHSSHHRQNNHATPTAPQRT